MAKSNKAKICLIIDPSDAYLRTKTQDIYEEWGFTRSTVKQMTEWKFIPKNPSLFGELIMTHLDLTNKNDLKLFVESISQRKTLEAFTGEWYGNGTIITASKAVGTKKIEKLVTESGGVIYKNEKSDKRKKELFDELSITNEVRTAVNFHVGEDYELMLSFTNEVGKLTPEEQKAITVQDSLKYFPPVPGSVPPWDYLNALMNGNTQESLELFRRTILNTHVLVALVFLNKKMTMLYRVKMAQEQGLYGNSIAAAIGESSSWELKSVTNVANRTTVNGAEHIAKIVAQLESDIKGGSAVDPNVLFEVAITKIGLLLGNRN